MVIKHTFTIRVIKILNLSLLIYFELHGFLRLLMVLTVQTVIFVEFALKKAKLAELCLLYSIHIVYGLYNDVKFIIPMEKKSLVYERRRLTCL